MAQEHPATSAEPELLGGRYQLLKTIGEGNYAKVKLAKHLPTGAEVAIKIVNLKDFASLHRFLAREVRCMKALQHPNIVQLYEAIEMKDMIFIVMEYASGGSMMDYLKSYGRIKENDARYIFRQLTSAVFFCHQHGIVHRDIKPENILFDSRMNVKIGDFGFSTEFGDSKLTTMCCSPSYAAPELFLGEDYEGRAVDIWSLGVTLYKMVSGHLPFRAHNCDKLAQEVIKGKYTVPYFFSFQLEAILKKMLTVKPEGRRDLVDIMSDPWIGQDEEEEDLMLYSDPHSESTDHWVNMEMRKLGFRYDDIQDTLAKKDFNNIMAAYLILKTNKHQLSCRTIHVKPYNPTGQSSATPGPSPDRTITPGPSPESSPEPRAIRPWWRTRTLITDVQSSSSKYSLQAIFDSTSPSSSTASRGSSGEMHQWQRLARRCCNCITKLCRRLRKKR